MRSMVAPGLQALQSVMELQALEVLRSMVAHHSKKQFGSQIRRHRVIKMLVQLIIMLLTTNIQV